MNRKPIINQCEQAGACEEEFDRLINAKTDEEFNRVLVDNIIWVIKNNIKVDFNEVFSICKLDGGDWCWLLMKQPQFAKHCDWKKLDGDDWSWLLREQPQFTEHCKWKKLNGGDWSWLLREQPQFSKFCDWSKLAKYDWNFLLEKQPQFASIVLG